MKKWIVPAALLLSLNSFAQTTPSRLTLTKGQKFELVTEMKRSQNIEAMGQNIETNMTVSSTEQYSVDETTADQTTVTRRMKRFFTSTSSPMMGDMTFDSDKESDRKGQMGEMIMPMLNEVLTLNIDSRGKLADVKSSAGAKKQDDGMMAMMAQQLGAGGKPEIGSDFTLTAIPPRALKVGDTWTDTSSNAAGKTSTTYKVVSITETNVVLDYTQSVKIKTTMNMMGQEGGIINDDSITGQITADRTTGLLKTKTANIESKGSISVQGMELPSSGKATINITVKPIQ